MDASLELSELLLRLRNYRGALRKLEKAKGRQNRMYWTKAVKHWENELDQHLASPETPGKTLALLIDQFKNNIRILTKELPRPIVEDIEYRFDAIVDTLLYDELQGRAVKEEISKVIKR